MIQTQFSTKIQILHTDRACDFFNFVLGDYLINQGIVHQSSSIDTPNKMVWPNEKNHHLLDVACSLLFTRNVPHNFFGDAVLTATYLINQLDVFSCP